MASLNEIKSKIASVRSTLKVTSAMKMVASAKLHKAQAAIGNMLPYESHLNDILVSLISSGDETSSQAAPGISYTLGREVSKVAIIAFASNQSLCGCYNSNAIKKVQAVVNEYKSAGIQENCITIYSFGKKMSEAMRKAGFESPHDFTGLSSTPQYAGCSELAQELMDGFLSGRFDKVDLVYNHFQSSASQPSRRETYLPLSVGPETSGAAKSLTDYIIEPSREEVVKSLLVKVLRLKIYTVLLDTAAAEQAARTIAMQTATDNGNDMLDDLTLEYNKSRQQKITNELLDIVSGTRQ
ncbi:MAG: ATP synthase F1 subunit gamma [Bacteroidales bacterium]